MPGYEIHYEEHLEVLKNKEYKIIYIFYKGKSLPPLNNVDHLEILWIYYNGFYQIPSLDQLENLQYFTVMFNNLIHFPPVDKLAELEYLYISRNKLKQIPSLSKLVKLTDLELIRNQLKQLPEHIARINCKNVADNNYPKWLNYERLVK